MKNTAHYQGLTEKQVLENRDKYGVNILTPPEKEPLWKQFLEKFSDPIIKILLVALVLSVGVACYQFFSGAEPASVFLEPVGILVAILLATCVGFAFEVSANKKFEILNQVNDDTMVQAIRGGNICEIPRRDVVVGDVVVLNTGEEVPADGVLLDAVSLQVNESTLTGEPLISKTTVEAEFKPDATYPSNHVLKGTTVVDGHGIMEVTAVGDKTEYGKVYEGSQIDNKVETPLNRQLSRLGDLITWASYAIAALIIIGRLTLYFTHLESSVDWLAAGSYILNTIMIAVTVIVVTVPEGLPMSVTLSLALSMKSMLKANNLVRKMHACETMGATTVICTDKTGTLTRNQMNVYKANFYGLGDALPAEDELGNLIREGIAVNSTAFLDYSDPGQIKALGNPTEGALLLWLHGQGVNYLDLRENARVLEQLTFSTERKYMATVVDSPLLGKKVLYVKGAPEIVLGNCATVRTPDGKLLDHVMDLKIMCRARPMDKERLVKLLQQKGQVVAVTGDGTNDAPALNAAQVGLSMGDGTTVAKEASAITILDNSFMSISRAVMWGRSLYRNIQRFIVFQMTINVAACLIVLIGAFLGTESPLTVTQMLWVNLIMDTFAALALASLPPDERVMQDPPRKATDHIITRPMGRDILGVGFLFVAFLFGLLQYFKHTDITSLAQFSVSGYLGSYLDFSSPEHELTPYELSLFFTIFVLLQFWNMFNAKAFNTNRSAFSRMGASMGGFGLVAFLILAGQYVIVTFGGKMFNVVPLSWTDWGLILGGTSIVLWAGELFRALTPEKPRS